MFQPRRILCFFIFCFVVNAINAEEPQTVESKCSNGDVINGTCVCEPDYTGTDCGVKIMSSEDIKLRDSIYECFEEAGSGSGSGEAPDESVKSDCKNAYKRYFDGTCQFINVFEGEITIKKEKFPKAISTSSEESPKALTKCMLNGIFSSLSFQEVEIGDIADDDIVIVVRYVIRTARGTTSEYLIGLFNAALAVAGDDLISDGTVKDRNECSLETDDCNVLAKCTNTEGSFTCACPFNFTDSALAGERPGSNCRHVCNDGQGGEYCLNEGECHITIAGEGVCSCPPNYAGKRCENEWHVFLNATIGLTAAFGISIIIFVFIILLLATRNRIKTNKPKREFVELESNAANGEYIATSNDPEVKAISNPYANEEEGITVPTRVEDDSEAAEMMEDDKL